MATFQYTSVSVPSYISTSEFILLWSLYVVPRPSPPSVTLMPQNSTSVKLVWMNATESDVVHSVSVSYTYQGSCQCTDNTDRICQQQMDNVTERSTIISNLEEHSTYMFTVTATNPAGTSEATMMSVTTSSSGEY